jgi:hypothetical protein
MAFEDFMAGIYLLMDEIQKRPEDSHILQEQLREKISELHVLGLPIPEDLQRLEDELSEDGAETLFNNMPV